MSLTVPASEIKNILKASYASLKKYQKEIDRLNVFPVPDGDTGTNMVLTMQKVVEEMEKENSSSLNEVGKVIVDGALMGARGNSGVILSQIIRGFFDAMKEKEEIDQESFYRGLKNSVKISYQAVRKPVEGTMLTVLREGVEAVSKKEGSLTGMMSAFVKGSKEALENTPELLPVLKEAGVVDAGGYGLVVMAEGVLCALLGESYEKTDLEELIKEPLVKKEESLQFAYCTEFLLRTDKLDPGAMEDKLAGLGDSILVVGSSPTFRIHVHTNNPGDALNIALSEGEISQVKINNMKEQVEEKKDSIQGEIGLVAVANGEGIKDIMRSLGVTEIVSGGQGLNPSTEEIAEAAARVKQKKVIILPSNKNIIMAAQAVKNLLEKDVYVVPTKSIPQSISAIMSFIPESDIEDAVEEMERTIKEITTCEVTKAVRDSAYKDLKINKGDFIGILDGEIVTSEKDLIKAFIPLIEKSIDENKSFISVLTGKDVDNKTREKIRKKLEKRFDECDIEIKDGGQPLYQIIAGME